MNEGPKTLRDWVGEGARRFDRAGLTYGHGYATAWDEAAALALFAGGLPADADHDVGEIRVDAGHARRIERLFRRRVEDREPVAYLTGEAWFAGLPMVVDRRVLIPRSPLAELIERGFTPWLRRSRPRVLDLCTGGGCIALACAHHLPDARVVGVDLSADALQVAEHNARRLGLAPRCEFRRGDLFDPVAGETFQLIVTNPPYVGAASYRGLPSEYRHEPALGLQAGEDGLDVALAILAQGVSYLASDGFLVMEVGEAADALEAAAPGAPWTWLEFERGGDGVLLLEADDWRQLQPLFQSLVDSRRQTA